MIHWADHRLKSRNDTLNLADNPLNVIQILAGPHIVEHQKIFDAWRSQCQETVNMKIKFEYSTDFPRVSNRCEYIDFSFYVVHYFLYKKKTHCITGLAKLT